MMGILWEVLMLNRSLSPDTRQSGFVERAASRIKLSLGSLHSKIFSCGLTKIARDWTKYTTSLISSLLIKELNLGRLSQKWLIDLRTFYSSLSSLLERLAKVRSFIKPVVNEKIDRVLKISGYVYGNDVVQDRTTSKPQSSEFPLQEKSLLQKTSQSSSSLPEIKIPTIMDRTAENSSSSRIGNAYLTKKSEAYPAATEIINNSPSRFAKKLRLPFVQNIFDIFKTSISEVISNVKQNLVPQGSPAQFEPVKPEDKKYFEKTPDINATVIIEGDTIKFEYADNAETMLGKEDDRKQKTGTENRDRHYFFK